MWPYTDGTTKRPVIQYKWDSEGAIWIIWNWEHHRWDKIRQHQTVQETMKIVDVSRPETITEEIAHAIIAALGSSENPVEQMLEMVKLLDQAGYKIVRKE